MLRTSLRSFSAAALVCAATGCATFGAPDPLTSIAVELADTPFYPQTEFMCGPSALASVLHRTNVTVTPEQLAEQVYVPERRGSLQLEMVAAARRYDRLAVEIDPDLHAIVEELAAGRPLLVLQNLGVKWLPFWHYAVIVGYDPVADSFVLRSGITQRLHTGRSSFAHSWARADNWAVVVLKPGELPIGADPAAYIQAVAGLESVGRFDAARQAYASGLTRWPANDLLLLGYANALYGAGEIERATNAYRDLLAIRPGHLPALNNLANALGELGCRAEALAVIDQASDSADTAFRAIFAQTRQDIESQTAGSCQLN